MEALALIFAGIVAIIIAAVARGNKILENLDPDKLSMEQLQMHQRLLRNRINAAYRILNNQSILDYDRPKNVALRAKIGKLEEQLKPISKEYDRRLSQSLSEQQAKCSEDRIVHIRKLAQAAYDGGWESSERLKNPNEKTRHQHALISTLLALHRADPSTPAVTQATVDALEFETTPFAILPCAQGRAAFIEYIIWRECPKKAKMAELLSAMHNLRASGFVSEVLGSAPKQFFETGPAWLKLIPEANRG